MKPRPYYVLTAFKPPSRYQRVSDERAASASIRTSDAAARQHHHRQRRQKPSLIFHQAWTAAEAPQTPARSAK